MAFHGFDIATTCKPNQLHYRSRRIFAGSSVGQWQVTLGHQLRVTVSIHVADTSIRTFSDMLLVVVTYRRTSTTRIGQCSITPERFVPLYLEEYAVLAFVFRV